MVSGSLTWKYDKKDSEEKVVYHQGGGLSSRWSFIKVVVSGWSLTGDATVSNFPDLSTAGCLTPTF